MIVVHMIVQRRISEGVYDVCLAGFYFFVSVRVDLYLYVGLYDTVDVTQ